MKTEDKDDIEIVYWGEDEDKAVVNEAAHRRRKREYNFNLQAEIISWIKLIGIALLVALCINYFVIINSVVPTGSMEQTIHKKSRMIGFRLEYLFKTPERGDIIIFKFPDNEEETYVKRVVGLPGETIKIEYGIVYINGKALEEDYVYYDSGSADLSGDFPATYIPDNCYFVLGDNRNDSEDSRYWKTTNFVEKDKILGKAIFCYYPDLYILH